MSSQSRADPLAIDEMIARMELAIVEAQRYRAEMPKLETERLMLSVERERLAVERERMLTEQAKRHCDRAMIQWQVVAALLITGGGLVGITLTLAMALHAPS